LSVKPNFAEAIIRGKKRYEFRRSIFTRPVDVVLVYATVPVKRIVAEFDVCSVISEKLPILWSRTQKYAGIDSEYFWEYFAGKDFGHAIKIGNVRPYKIPFCPVKEFGIRPPQSFIYLEAISGRFI
jgi:predicted transcriptional regulator